MTKYCISIITIFFILISCERNQTVPQSLVRLNDIIPNIKDSAYYYSYYKDWFTSNDTIAFEERKNILKKTFNKSKFITINNKKYLIIATPMVDGDMIRIYGKKNDTIIKLFGFCPYQYNDKDGYDWVIIHNKYIIVHTSYRNGSNFMFDSYDYIYGFKKDDLVILDSINTRHRINTFEDMGMETVATSSYATVINWKFISENCILKTYESGEVYRIPRTDTIIFKPNSKKCSAKKCF